MRVLAVSPSELAVRLCTGCGGADPLTTAEGLAEMLRAEASALGVARRCMLADRVCALLRPAGEVPVKRVLEVMLRLEAHGDLVPGPLGRVAAAPLRAVQAGPGHYILLGGGASAGLGAALGELLAPALLRRLRTDPARDEVLAAAVARCGGRMLSIESWAGLDRTPPADAGWLALLNERLRSPLERLGAQSDLAISPGALEHYVAGMRRWRQAGSRLVRVRQPMGWFAYAWLGPEGEAMVCRDALMLSRDEARRTQFALDAEAGRPLRLQAGSTGAVVRLDIPGLLPFAEYRFLLGLAERTAGEGLPVCYLLAVEDLPRVAACLAQRLGVCIDDVSTEAR